MSLLVLPYFFVSVLCAKLSWPDRQLLRACKYSISYSIQRFLVSQQFVQFQITMAVCKSHWSRGNVYDFSK